MVIPGRILALAHRHTSASTKAMTDNPTAYTPVYLAIHKTKHEIRLLLRCEAAWKLDEISALRDCKEET